MSTRGRFLALFFAAVALLAAVALGSWQTDPLAGLPLLPITASGSTSIQLDRLGGRYTLPDRVDGLDLPDAWPLTGFVRSGLGWATPLPFLADDRGREAPPEDMEVDEGGRRLPFAGGPLDEGWFVRDGQLMINQQRAPVDVIVKLPRLHARLARLDPARAGLSTERFVRYELVGRDARTGLLLPAPATAEWDVTVPAGGSFRTDLAIVGLPRAPRGGDGAVAILSVIHRQQTDELDRQTLPADGGAAIAWDVDLGAYVGQAVTLRLIVDPIADPAGDLVFLGAPVVTGSPDALPRRVVVIAIDTLRPDHLGAYGYTRPTSPALDAIYEQSTVFPRAWAPAPRTRPSFRTSTTGRWPLAAVGATSLGEVFRAHGFATAGFVANIHLHPRFQFHVGYDLWRLSPEARADQQVDDALAWLDDHRQRDAMLFVHFMDPHLRYQAPIDPERFVDDPDPSLPTSFSRWHVNGWQRAGKLTERRKTHIEALYDGEIAFMDGEIGRLLAAIDATPGPTLIVVHSDHGEEFWEHGGFEHNHTLREEVMRAALWFRGPGFPPGAVDQPASLADLAPTLYRALGFVVAGLDGTALQPYVDGTAADDLDERPLPIGHLRYDRQRWGVVWREHKYELVTADGTEELYDLRADPTEQIDLSAREDLAPYRLALARAHDMTVAPGWRAALAVHDGLPVEITLPAAAEEVGVYDPEALTAHPANEEWGERPSVTVEDVGAVALSADRMTVTFTPGPHPSATIWIRFADPVALDGTIVAHADEVRGLTDAQFDDGAARVTLSVGTIVVPPADEAARIEALRGATDGELRLLRDLGYIGD